MKVLHAGNMANLGYVICRHLRKTGLDVELLIEKNPPKGSDPLRFDPTLNNQYPDWISFFDKSKSSWKLDVIRKMREKKYDLIHAYVEFPIFAYFSGKPFLAHTQGSDFREMAQSKTLRGFLLRRAYRKAKAVLFFQPDHLPLFSKLKLYNGIFIAPLWDTTFFRAYSNKANNKKFTIFHPANLEFRLKGNDKLIKGYAEFVKNYPESNLIIVDRGIDSHKIHEMVKNLSIEDKVEFIDGPLNASQLLKYYNQSDVIADQFVLGALGSIGWETFSCKKPLLAFANEKQYRDVYGESPPVVNAFSSKDICISLTKLTNNEFRKEIGNKGYEWLTKYHSPVLFTEKIMKIYNCFKQKQTSQRLKSINNMV
ncbi:glycosyltransferase [Candidatus Nitrosotenuis uzonensis]|uniref:Glycosyl transferase family 1 domain-containing protein n=1 Tax=Candidatus Nitrosotenuis uzonensis TaxID=1407055 RepID=V6AV92_9ARCH|nr:glycosyltransferase [Candidatus Nitrosotenuis uzonensis]CDI06469.1 hypothetical protein NITUZ_50016 [Candidatus Nitrosotenuis uzonensis]